MTKADEPEPIAPQIEDDEVEHDEAAPSAEDLAKLEALKAAAREKRAVLKTKARETTKLVRTLMRDLAKHEQAVNAANEAVSDQRFELGVEEDAEDFVDVAISLDEHEAGWTVVVEDH